MMGKPEIKIEAHGNFGAEFNRIRNLLVDKGSGVDSERIVRRNLSEVLFVYPSKRCLCQWERDHVKLLRFTNTRRLEKVGSETDHRVFQSRNGAIVVTRVNASRAFSCKRGNPSIRHGQISHVGVEVKFCTERQIVFKFCVQTNLLMTEKQDELAQKAQGVCAGDSQISC